MSNDNLVPEYYELEPCYCRLCGVQLEIDERFICTDCDEIEDSTDENLFL